MATTTKQDAPKDDLPEIDDDVEIEAAETHVDDGADAPADSKPAQTKRYDAREEAVARYRELRAKEMGAETDEGDAAADADGEEDPAPAPVVAAPKATPAPRAEDDPVVELKVHGEVRTMKRSEALAHAQRALASEDILEEAKRTLADARAQRGKPSDPADQRDDDDGLNAQDDDPSSIEPAPKNQRAPKLDPAKLESIVERIQIGDKAEGSAALGELIEELASVGKAETVKPDEIGRVVNQQIARANFRNEIQEATTSFRGKYQSIVADAELLDTSLRRLTSELRDDLSKVGYDDKKLGSMSQDDLMEAHQNARMSGKEVRSYGALFEKVGTDMASKYGAVLGSREDPPPPASRQTTTPPTPQPSTRIAERVDRKRAAAVQPRAAGARAQAEPQQRPKSRQDVVAEMRRARGFTV